MGDESGLIDDACSRFEAAWQTGQQPRIEDFLPPHRRKEGQRCVTSWCNWLASTSNGVGRRPRCVAKRPASQAVSQGTAMCRQPRSASLRPRLADYVARYPLLGPVEQLPCDLIVNEYYARRRYGDRPTHAEYLDAFGSLHPDLAKQLQAIDDGMVSDLLDPSSESLPETRLWQPGEPESRQTGDDTTSKQAPTAPEESAVHPTASADTGSNGSWARGHSARSIRL